MKASKCRHVSKLAMVAIPVGLLNSLTLYSGAAFMGLLYVLIARVSYKRLFEVSSDH